MFRRALVLLAALIAAEPVAAQSVDGTWKLSYSTPTSLQASLAIFKLKLDNNKLDSESVAGNYKVQSATLKGDSLHVVLSTGFQKLDITAAVPKEAGKRITGNMVVGNSVYPCWLEATEETTLPKGLRPIDCKPLAEAKALETKIIALKRELQMAKDAEQKKELKKGLDEAQGQAAKLYKEVVGDFAASPAVFEAVLKLIRSADSSGASADDVKSWVTAGNKAAAAYGSKWASEFKSQLTTALADQAKGAGLAIEYAKIMEKALTPKSAASDQIKVYSLLARAYKKAGNTAEAKGMEARVEKIEVVLDHEYHKTMPPFKGEAFTGRKSKSERTVFMELFTGATCPPCVAADLAFDVLQKSYKPTELVLVQYHMHIPGPDPMTNPDTEARWKYYGKLGGVPSSLFNGKPLAGGGGGIPQAEKKYEQYRGIIDPLLETDAAVKLDATAVRKGNEIDITVEVANLDEPTSEKKLRILLAEESIRYLGSNGIRFHHNVVRAFPGGVAGKALTEPKAKVQASVNLGDLRGGLAKYLDESGKVFGNPARPLALANLRVIAFVQDDATKEILQVKQVEVHGK